MTENRYVFDNAVTAETGMRFSGLEATFDPSTIRYLSGVGVTDGWACWEIGAGGKRPRYRHRSPVHPGLHAEPACGRPLVLSHLPQRSGVMVRLVRALRPGGWLVIEDFSGAFERGSKPVGPAETRYRKVHVALGEFLARANDDQSDFAASLPQLLASLGLADIGAEARVVFGRGGSPGARVMEAGLRQVGDQMIAAGLVDRLALDEAIAYLAAPASIVSLPTMVSAWGRQR